MFTFALLYICIYYQILYMLFFYLYIYMNIKNLQNFNLINLLTIIKTYAPQYNLFFLLFILLSGLPPVIFFIIKLVFLIHIFQYISLSMQILLFINFFLSMLFYLQGFNATKKNLFINTTLITLSQNGDFFYTSVKNTQNYSKIIYKY